MSVVMLTVGIGVFAPNPGERPNRNLLISMCLWAVSIVAGPESVLSSSRVGACLVGFISSVLSGETRGRLGADVLLEDMGPHELKGVERVIPLYRLR